MKDSTNISLNPKINLTRRTFLYGGAAVLAASGLGLSACANKKASQYSDAKIKSALSYATTNYNVVGQTNALMMAVDWHTYEGLYELDYHTYEPYPALADGMPEKIDDYTYKVKLRANAKFSNGAEVTPKDVVGAIGANITNTTYRSYLDFLKSVEADGDLKSVVIHLKYPFDSLLTKRLTIPKIYQVSSNDSASKMKIGSGPWIVTDINGEDGGHISFTPNQYYNGSKAKPKDEMYWNVILDSTARTTAISEQTSYAIENCPDSNIENIKKSGANVDYERGFAMALMIFNTLSESFKDKRVRQAVMYGIDVQKIIQNQLNGQAYLPTCYMPENHPNYHRASTVYAYNPEKAKQLLKEAGKENLTFEIGTGPTWVKDLTPQIKNDMESIGVTCNIKTETIAGDTLGDKDEVLPYDVIINNGDPAAFGNDPDLAMNIGHGDNIWNHGRTCWAKNPESRFNELQKLLQEARSASGTRQQELGNQCYDIIADQLSLYPLLHRNVATGYLTSKLSDYKPIATTGLYFIGAKGN